MKRGCFISLLAWGACAYGYWYVCHARLVGPIRWVLPVGGGLIMALVIGGLRNAFTSARDAMRLSRAGEPGGVIGERPQDGDLVTVSGHIRASGSPMHAPLSGRPAVLYTYDISHTVTSKNEVREVNDFSGYGLSSAVIDSPHGAMRLLGFPTLERFGKETLDAAVAKPIAEKYVEETQFTDLSGFHPGMMYREIKDVLTDDDGHLKKDWRMVDRPKPAAVAEATASTPEEGEKEEAEDLEKEWLESTLTAANYFEQIVAPGDQVSAIGRYSAQKGGLVPDMTHPLELLRGDAHAAAGTLWRKMAVQVVGALFFAAILNGIVFGVLKLHKPGAPIAFSSETIRQSTDALHDAAREGNLARVEQLVNGGMPADARDEEKTTPLMRASSANVASWLIAHGADVNAANKKGETPLMRQAQLGHADVVRLLVKSGANVDAKETEYKMTALQMALDAEKLDVVQVLRDAGAKDQTVTEKSGQPVAENSDEVRVCREYLDAVQHEDRKALSDLSTLGSFHDVDFSIWKKVRFATGRVVSGYANENAATISMRGATPNGIYVTWTYDLVRQGDAWKIAGERWETRLNGSEP